jgi:hypothetical protein
LLDVLVWSYSGVIGLFLGIWSVSIAVSFELRNWNWFVCFVLVDCRKVWVTLLAWHFWFHFSKIDCFSQDWAQLIYKFLHALNLIIIE